MFGFMLNMLLMVSNTVLKVINPKRNHFRNDITSLLSTKSQHRLLLK